MINANYSTNYNDVYFSAAGGLAESSLVFIEGNRLFQRLTEFDTENQGKALIIAELGFGSGLNLVALLHGLSGLAHRPFVWYSVDETWLDRSLRHELLGQFPEAGRARENLLGAIDSETTALTNGGIVHVARASGWSVEVFQGDVGNFEAILPDTVDAWILDGHSPDKNPAMWSNGVFSMMAKHSIVGHTSFATYSSAGVVKQGLRAAGFTVLRRKGFGQKRHRLEGVFTGQVVAEGC